MTNDIARRTRVLAPGQTVGILGGGQLGRMLAIAAARLGLRAHVYDADPACPAGEVAGNLTTASFDDRAAMERFAARVDAITVEWESVPTSALAALDASPPLRPPLRALNILQDRLTEKQFLSELGLRTAPFAAVSTVPQLSTALARLGYPAILKTRRHGYDGKGQVRITSPDDLHDAQALVEAQPCILEGLVTFEREVSVVAARSAQGKRACYEPGENEHRDGILRTTTVPANLSAALRRASRFSTELIMQALDYVGVLGVEFFVTSDGLVVNEVAPRVHNSGHWTETACYVSQFEQHIRAVAGWPLGTTERHGDVTMHNLIGDEADLWREHVSTPGVTLHLYGKSETRPDRKMGHLNRVRPVRAPTPLQAGCALASSSPAANDWREVERAEAS
ncbi:MAG: 5-(carboxyamino)imidazole ribonucleotide synthase [Myxococcales bacterium]|nr:5-(carboxyamino)imidazole ribonucleotide synthase [Myxococcales bacterium]